MRQHLNQRTAAIVPLSALFMICAVVAVVFAAEIGRMGIIQSELQRAADAGALAGAWNLASQFNLGESATDAISSARTAAQGMVGNNAVRGVSPELDPNSENVTSGDIVFGRFTGFGDASADMTPLMSSETNAVAVCVHKDDVRNGASELGLAKLLGVSTLGSNASATAAWIREIRGFNSPTTDETLGILPFAVKKSVWDAFLAGSGTDNWNWSPPNKTISAGPDGIKELNIYPANTAASGNFGTVDIGSSNNSTDDLKRQILDGVSASDLAYLGGKLELGLDGTLLLNGDTGISTSIKDELSHIIGKPRVILIYSSVSGNGNTAYFTIVKFVGIRITEVKLTGNPKRIMVQPATVTIKSVIPSGTETSDQVYSPIVLVK
jgi:putative Flp pilus-assembly TadE/G-like protein